MKKKAVIGIGSSDTRTYGSIMDAANDIGGQASHISECIRGTGYRHTHKGYRWMEENSYDTMGTTKN